ncbi:O-antigen ligase family protein [Solirubrobacter sp. CPCC 204708]|uniref:O-antigen ligase family protein n=1 Tax=Solirubrobacter deserti TaxID=2282478 RepID=A0ABT4RSH1_9ACTN|nr:O-antigen ligase family protein [Solirubrobacter deserti]MBE2316395.1 O-antigen ligase family protein [Solirubrobacter deserti]MDA0141525.1 O-antigen ligase family protein [Solirubrobacter deserti]
MARSRLILALPVLALPVGLTFAKGGYFDVPRLAAGVIACALVVVAAVATKRPLPRERAPRLALLGLAALTAWTGASLAWAPIAGVAGDDLQRLLLYLATFTAALALLPPARRIVEPVLLAGIVAAALYGLSERLLPGVFELQTLPSANDRLAWPLTYWNAMGALMGMGLVLAAATRNRVAAAAAPLLGLALYLTFSRGALGATAVGVAALLALEPTRERLTRTLLVAVAAAIPALATFALGDLERPGGSAAQGAAMLALLAVTSAAAAALFPKEGLSLFRKHPRFFQPAVRIDPHEPKEGQSLFMLRAVAIGVLVLALGATIVLSTSGGPTETPANAEASRLLSTQSNRDEYWRVALSTFAEHPLNGAGSGAFRTEWLREREIPEAVRDAHSLYFETAAELGLVGLAALALFLGGIVGMARRNPQAGAVAALVVYAAHAGLDWDWELPALTLFALVLAARLADEAPSADARPAPS